MTRSTSGIGPDTTIGADPGSDPSIAVDDGGDVTLPLQRILTGRTFLTGKSGSGKSNSVSVIAEELLSRGIPLLIVDADGEYVGLDQQYEVLHAGKQPTHCQGDVRRRLSPGIGG